MQPDIARTGAPPIGEEAPVGTDLRAASLSGVRWVSLSRLVAELLTVVSAIVLARLIPPAEFGHAAVALGFTAIALGVAWVGFGTPLIQMKSIDRGEVEVATFLGNPPMNVLPARVSGGRAILGESVFDLPTKTKIEDGDVMLGIRPSEIALGAEGAPATVTLCEVLGEDVIVDLDLGGQLLRAKTPGRQRIAEGERVCVHIDPARLHVFDHASGRRIEP